MGKTIARMAHQSQMHLIGGNGLDHLYLNPDSHTGELGSPESFSQDRIKPILSEADILIEFSTPSGNEAFLTQLSQLEQETLQQKAILIGTTGLSSEQIIRWQQLSEKYQLRLLIAPNTSLGVLLLLKLSQQAAAILSPEGFDIEMVETHHRHKLDAPSGTAKFLAQALAEQQNLRIVTNRSGQRQDDELGVVAIRGGNVFGEHVIQFIGEQEELFLGHRAFSRELFAKGALKLSKWLLAQRPGSFVLQDIELNSLANL